MNRSKRKLLHAIVAGLGASLISTPGGVFAKTVSAKAERSTPSESIIINVAKVASSSMSVPIEIITNHSSVTSIAIIVERNTVPLQIHAEMIENMDGYLSTFISMEQSSNVTVQVVSSARTFHKTVHIEVMDKQGCIIK